MEHFYFLSLFFFILELVFCYPQGINRISGPEYSRIDSPALIFTEDGETLGTELRTMNVFSLFALYICNY